MKEPLELKDMIWSIKFLMAGEEEIKRIITNFRDAILKYNNQEIKWLKKIGGLIWILRKIKCLFVVCVNLDMSV